MVLYGGVEIEEGIGSGYVICVSKSARQKGFYGVFFCFVCFVVVCVFFFFFNSARVGSMVLVCRLLLRCSIIISINISGVCFV